MVSSSQRPLPDNTQHPQQTNIHDPDGIRTHDRNRRAAVDLRLRPRGYWDRHCEIYRDENRLTIIRKKKITVYIISNIQHVSTKKGHYQVQLKSVEIIYIYIYIYIYIRI